MVSIEKTISNAASLLHSSFNLALHSLSYIASLFSEWYIVTSVQKSLKSIHMIQYVVSVELKPVVRGERIQVIPGNLQKYVSTNRSLLQCKTLPAHSSNNMFIKRYLKAR